jgi:oligopeptide/dipeptide ABC transporter ATP-binding protein
VAQSIQEPLDVHGIGTPREREQKVEDLLDVVGLRKQVLSRYPHEFSGGQRQRIGIARALALNPEFIVADEPVSALDVSVQSQVLNLIARLQREHGISFLFISHDLAVIQHVSDDVGVMYLGKLVEFASARDLYRDPRHPYTRALMSAIPVPDPKKKSKRIILQGDVPSPMDPPGGCPFHTRCPEAMPVCRQEFPRRVNVGTESAPHLVNCHLFVPESGQQSPPNQP